MGNWIYNLELPFYDFNNHHVRTLHQKILISSTRTDKEILKSKVQIQYNFSLIRTIESTKWRIHRFDTLNFFCTIFHTILLTPRLPLLQEVGNGLPGLESLWQTSCWRRDASQRPCAEDYSIVFRRNFGRREQGVRRTKPTRPWKWKEKGVLWIQKVTHIIKGISFLHPRKRWLLLLSCPPCCSWTGP